MTINPYLLFNGQCREAFQFYEKALGGKIEMMMTNGESPMANHTPPNRRDHILHATLRIGDHALQGSDAPDHLYRTPQGFSVSINITDTEEAERMFQALSENAAAIQMPLQQTFWAQRFGMLIDRFGVPWMINCGTPA